MKREIRSFAWSEGSVRARISRRLASTFGRRWARSLTSSIFVLGLLVACASEDSQTADTGGVGGTGISQGTISAFGSIFVNGVEWNLVGATFEFDDRPGSERELRLGMNVRIVGAFSSDGLSGTASSVEFDDSIEGPISDVPVLVGPGATEKTFTIFGQTILVSDQETQFADGATFSGIGIDQVVEVSGFDAGANTIRATRVALRGVFPAVLGSTLRGDVRNLVKNPDGSGIFDIGIITIRYLASTEFSDVTREGLMDGMIVDVAGDVRLTGSEIDAVEIDREEGGLGQQDAEDVELEGIVSDFVSLADFRLSGVPVNASGASLEPSGLVVANGSRVEAEGRLAGGVLLAEVLESEEDERGEFAVEAAVTSVDASAREVTILGIVVFADGDTEIEDERDGDENFQFAEIQVGDWLKIEGFEAGPARARAKQIARDSTGRDVVLRGPVTALDRLMPALSVLDQSISLSGTTSYFDSLGQPRTEEEFFRTPGDLNPGDDVVVIDEDAVAPDALSEVDTIGLD